jgi:hypothetical protein
MRAFTNAGQNGAKRKEHFANRLIFWYKYDMLGHAERLI